MNRRTASGSSQHDSNATGDADADELRSVRRPAFRPISHRVAQPPEPRREIFFPDGGAFRYPHIDDDSRHRSATLRTTRSPRSPAAAGHRAAPGGRRGRAPGRRTSRLVPARPALSAGDLQDRAGGCASAHVRRPSARRRARPAPRSAIASRGRGARGGRAHRLRDGDDDDDDDDGDPRSGPRPVGGTLVASAFPSAVVLTVDGARLRPDRPPAGRAPARQPVRSLARSPCSVRCARAYRDAASLETFAARDGARQRPVGPTSYTHGRAVAAGRRSRGDRAASAARKRAARPALRRRAQRAAPVARGRAADTRVVVRGRRNTPHEFPG